MAKLLIRNFWNIMDTLAFAAFVWLTFTGDGLEVVKLKTLYKYFVLRLLLEFCFRNKQNA